jgi:hypothetical protein
MRRNTICSGEPLLKTSFRFQAVTFAVLAGLNSFGTARATIVGPFEGQILETYLRGAGLSKCELTAEQKNMRLTIARALDDHETDFEGYHHSLPPTGSRDFSGVSSIGPLVLSPRLAVPKVDDTNGKPKGWRSSTSGWADFFREYQAIRLQHVNARWDHLRDIVAATIADDFSRGVRRNWMGLSAESVDQAPGLATSITDCLTDSKKCDSLAKSDSFQDALSLTSYAASDYADYKSAKTDAAKTAALRTLLGEVKPFLTYYDPIKQSGVRFIDSNTLVISLDPGAFGPVETNFGLMIERDWKLGDNALKVEWMTATHDSPIFTFLLNPTPKGGSQIDFLRRTITLGQGAVASIPAHEVGRAMGFRARYFSVWHADTCKYEDESKPDDLLSDGRSGSVLETHWAALKKVYAAPKP